MAIPVVLPSSKSRSAILAILCGNGQDASRALASHIGADRDLSEDSFEIGEWSETGIKENVKSGQVSQNAK